MITSFDQLDPTKQYTYADYLKWQFQERLELIKGYIYKMSPAPSRRHQDIVWNLNVAIGNHIKGHPCKAYSAPFDVRLPVKDKKSNQEITTVLQPDICVICDLSKLDDKGCLGAPDLVIEVLSPGNSLREIDQKFNVYEESGVREYWVVYPEYSHVNIFLLDESGKFVGQHPKNNGELLRSTVFPELVINLSEVFSE
ncbi:Uma2 family endonuclease [Dyadobacter sp. BE34]|uniref:Uma2 family endonuclease n=1 Tax=Dyadobacter fermentans TaxID=94254 RepID=A0ABU1QQT4_9BACT|nr:MULTISPECIES: Uma2 family endonuclease [Dyadobacter]MDR6803509.1 Uma2 family endonuclease [Dyadobacter fermentans]MDR7041250.1 Uma2 family endonuclease [Dyadobacter sp. BE242]MDR7195653.1 Uma2 family endonuclease [Dyadobacter sp. BE34]MDR7213802.1 Uma2 family endonuclease [Dyadobacter sp. BE31]MDR7261060.1 Uma2 family endonuclease [Dyadobacter sp. BE32]